MSIDSVIEGAVKRDRVVILVALSIVVVMSWAYVLAGAGMPMSAFDMTRMMSEVGCMDMMAPAAWNIGYAGLMFVMWWIMMIGMMLPSAAPTLLLFAALNRKRKEDGAPFAPTALFASAYLTAWAGFSIIAVALQWGLQRAALLSPMLNSASAGIGGMLLLAAGLYQLSPLKRMCLKHCRSPLRFILVRWGGGASGAFRMGLEHGAYCVGCCWLLMGLMFFGGVMNLYWMIGLMILVLLEKTIPGGRRLGDVVGAALIVWGAAVLAGPQAFRFLGYS